MIQPLKGLWILIAATQGRPSQHRANPGLNEAIPLGLKNEAGVNGGNQPARALAGRREGAGQNSWRLALILTFSPWEKEQTSPAAGWARVLPGIESGLDGVSPYRVGVEGGSSFAGGALDGVARVWQDRLCAARAPKRM